MARIIELIKGQPKDDDCIIFDGGDGTKKLPISEFFEAVSDAVGVVYGDLSAIDEAEITQPTDADTLGGRITANDVLTHDSVMTLEEYSASSPKPTDSEAKQIPSSLYDTNQLNQHLTEQVAKTIFTNTKSIEAKSSNGVGTITLLSSNPSTNCPSVSLDMSASGLTMYIDVGNGFEYKWSK